MSKRLHQSVSNLETAEETFAFDANTAATPFAGNDEAASGETGEEAGELPPLRDAFEASFRPPASSFAAAVLAAQVAGSAGHVADTRAYPYRTIAFLHIVAADKSEWRGTAFLVSPRTLITAGHNVYLHDHGGWAGLIELYPGRDSLGTPPFGMYKSQKFNTVRGWIDARDPGYDYGAIVLDRDIGSSLGFFGIHAPSDGELDSLDLDLAGYPKVNGEQWEGRGRKQEADERRIFYDIPTAIGQSGGPVWFADAPPSIVGVHGYESGSWNSALRVNPDVHAQMRAWRL